MLRWEFRYNDLTDVHINPWPRHDSEAVYQCIQTAWKQVKTTCNLIWNNFHTCQIPKLIKTLSTEDKGTSLLYTIHDKGHSHPYKTLKFPYYHKIIRIMPLCEHTGQANKYTPHSVFKSKKFHFLAEHTAKIGLKFFQKS